MIGKHNHANVKGAAAADYPCYVIQDDSTPVMEEALHITMTIVTEKDSLMLFKCFGHIIRLW